MPTLRSEKICCVPYGSREKQLLVAPSFLHYENYSLFSLIIMVKGLAKICFVVFILNNSTVTEKVNTDLIITHTRTAK